MKIPIKYQNLLYYHSFSPKTFYITWYQNAGQTYYFSYKYNKLIVQSFALPLTPTQNYARAFSLKERKFIV